jgi:tripartite ATP-independent transporter DctP family solute receptor
MRNNLRVRIVALAAGAGLALAACSSAATGTSDPGQASSEGEGSAGEIEQRELVFAYITAETFPYHDGAEKFAELVEEKSDGAITATLFPGGQLGQERDINESILDGTVHIGVGAGALAGVAPIVNILELPFLIENQDHMNAIVASPVADQLAERIREEGGYHVLAWFSTGDSSIQTVDTPIEEPTDLQGLKLRSIENAALADALSTLGANPTPMPYGEVYTGVQTGVIEGATLDWGSVLSMRLHELVGYVTTPEQAFLAEPRPIIVSADFWDALNETEQEVISEAMTEAAEFERELFKERQAAAFEEIAASGVEVTDLDAAAFEEALRPVWDKWAADLDAEEILDGIIGARE